MCSIAKRSKRFIVKFLAFSTHTQLSNGFLFPGKRPGTFPSSTRLHPQKRKEKNRKTFDVVFNSQNFLHLLGKDYVTPDILLFFSSLNQKKEIGKMHVTQWKKKPRRVIQFFHSSSSRNFVIGSRLNITYEFHFFIK